MAVDTELSVRAFLQFINVSDHAAANLRLRYNLGDGNHLWWMYNGRANFKRDRVGLVLLRTDAGITALKYTQTFAWKTVCSAR